MLPHKVVLPQTQNLPVSNSARSQSTSAYNKIDASIHHPYRCKLAWWRHVFRLQKKSQWVCFPFVPTFCLTFAAIEPYFSSVSARILATLRSMEVLTHLPGWTNTPCWRHGDSWTLTTDVAMSLWSTNHSLFSMMPGLNHCNSSSRCHATPGQFLEISCFPCVFCTLSCLYRKKKDDTANTSSRRRNGNTVNTVTATTPGISIPNMQLASETFSPQKIVRRSRFSCPWRWVEMHALYALRTSCSCHSGPSLVHWLSYWNILCLRNLSETYKM